MVLVSVLGVLFGHSWEEGWSYPNVYELLTPVGGNEECGKKFCAMPILWGIIMTW